MTYKNKNSHTTLYRTLTFLLLLASIAASATTQDESPSRTLQAGRYSAGGGSSGYGLNSSTALGAGVAAGYLANSGFFHTSGGKVVGVLLAVVIFLLFIYYKCIRQNQGEAPSETKFFEGNNQGDEADEDNDSVDVYPFHSGLYTGIYDQHGARQPVAPFELYFQEQFLEDDDESGPFTLFHTITGKGADTVGPYTLSGKSVGNKISLTKKYYGAGNMVSDIAHEVTLRLDKLGDTHIFEGKYYVNTEEVHEQGLYQIWPIGYNTEHDNTPLPPQPAYPPPQIPTEEAEINFDEQNPAPIATATAVPIGLADEDEEEFVTISLYNDKR